MKNYTFSHRRFGKKDLGRVGNTGAFAPSKLCIQGDHESLRLKFWWAFGKHSFTKSHIAGPETIQRDFCALVRKCQVVDFGFGTQGGFEVSVLAPFEIL